MQNEKGPDQIELEKKYGPIDFEVHLKSIKTKERLVDCEYCTKEYVVDIPIRRRVENEVIGIYSCPYCKEENLVIIADPLTVIVTTEKATDSNDQPRYLQEYTKFEGRKKLVAVKIAIRKK